MEKPHERQKKLKNAKMAACNFQTSDGKFFKQ